MRAKPVVWAFCIYLNLIKKGPQRGSERRYSKLKAKKLQASPRASSPEGEQIEVKVMRKQFRVLWAALQESLTDLESKALDALLDAPTMHEAAALCASTTRDLRIRLHRIVSKAWRILEN